MKKISVYILAFIAAFLVIMLMINRKGEINYNSEGLTWRAVMGSQGDELIRGDKINKIRDITLTEHDSIQFIHFHFTEGDHAVPGIYSRKNFLKNWKAAELNKELLF